MLFKIVNYTVMGIALFYAAEGTHLIERGKYFPTLPRLEASASDPRAWLGAAQWGVAQVVHMSSGSTALASNDYSSTSGSSKLDFSQATTFTKRLEEKRDAARQLASSYYGS